MRRLDRLALAALAMLVAACGPSLDAPALAGSVAPTFANLLVRAQEQQGRTDVTAAGLRATATCSRGGGDTLDAGPGADWRCLVTFTPPGAVAPQQVPYEVTLAPDGCWTAEGSPAVVGEAQVVDVDGVLRVNPISAFDGCL